LSGRRGGMWMGRGGGGVYLGEVRRGCEWVVCVVQDGWVLKK